MTINELSEKIDTAKQLGFGDSIVCVDDSRDGDKSYPFAKCEFVNSGDQREPQTLMVFSHA